MRQTPTSPVCGYFEKCLYSLVMRMRCQKSAPSRDMNLTVLLRVVTTENADQLIAERSVLVELDDDRHVAFRVV